MEATSLDAVAAEIGIRKQTILYYFPSKDALVKGVIEHAAQEVGTALGASAARHRHGADRVEAVVDEVYRMGAERPETIVLLREVSRLGPVQATDLRDAIEPLIARAVAALAADGVEPGTGPRVLLSAGRGRGSGHRGPGPPRPRGRADGVRPPPSSPRAAHATSALARRLACR